MSAKFIWWDLGHSSARHATWSFNDFSINCHNFSVIIQRQKMLLPKTLMFNTFLPVIDELDLNAQFVHQFEDCNFRLLEKLIFPGASFRFNRQLSMKN